MTSPRRLQAQASPAAPQSISSALKLLVMRLHFYVGLFVGPFIFMAALTGTLYVLTPQIETWLYRDQLEAKSEGPAQPLAAQVMSARTFIGEGPRLFAVRPSARDGLTTQVMFTQPGLGDSESRAVFIDSASLKVQGDLVVYGTSGILPFRTALDYLHRNLLLGDFGRNYSELAASWLWVAVLGGMTMWFWQRHSLRTSSAANAPARRRHSTIGLWIGLGLLFLSATGLTWSRWAGANIDLVRSELAWVTPPLSLELGADAGDAVGGGEHVEHQAHAVAQAKPPRPEEELRREIDGVLATARRAGIDSAQIEIRPPRNEHEAWSVREYDRAWPTQVDAVAIDPARMEVTSRADFQSFPLVAKLIRWGIDAHMGILFGTANQVLMATLGVALMAMVAYGYRIWWLKRPAPPSGNPRSLVRAWSHLSGPAKLGSGTLALALGLALPLMGLSLIAFVCIDLIRWGLAGLLNEPAGRSKRA